ncbi:GWT1 domain containing protein [Trichuris trichiura]|uniref:GWT1 domain containing protein n=1 Tax=Trichuris trichiura TaxID=36087 RepID=A0A077ZFJ7_TRITR|nr:GWT1 domain containing protein [Trichuris trichiura]
MFLQGDDVQEYLFQEPRYRENGLFNLNREGIVSVVGCLAIFHIATDVGSLLYGCRFVMAPIQNGQNKRDRMSDHYRDGAMLRAWQLRAITFPSHRLLVLCFLDCECRYILRYQRSHLLLEALLSFTDVFLLLMVTVIAFLFYYQNGLHTNMRTEDYYYLYDGSLWQAINASGLSYFLLCNVFTGIVKMSTSTVVKMSVQTSLAVIFCYAFATSLFARSQWGHLEAIRWRRTD